MHPAAAADLPPIALLPSTDAVLLEAARDVAVLGGGCLAIGRSPMMVLAAPGDAWMGHPMLLWDERLAAAPDIAAALYADARAAPALAALARALDALVARLRQWRWTGAEGGSLCAITDGTGLALMAAPAGAIDLDWLLAAAAAHGGATTILPFADDGLWTLLGEAGPRTLH